MKLENLDNYFNGDPNFSAEQEQQLLRLNAALRSVITHTIKANASAEALSALADQAEALDEAIKPWVGERALPAYSKVFKFDDVSATYAYSPITGRANPVAPPMESRIENDEVISEVTFGTTYEGPPGCVHGGIVALAWDHVLAAATMINDSRGPTATLQITYLKPTPLNVPLQYKAWIDRIEGKKSYVKGQCIAAGQVVTEAEGLFINTLIREIDVTEDDLKQQIEK